MTVDELIQRFSSGEIAFLRLEYVDFNGITRGRTIRRPLLEEVLHHGINISLAVLEFDFQDRYVVDHRYGASTEDVWGVPDAQTLALLPYRDGMARAFVDLIARDGQPWDACPRTILKRVLREAEEALGGKIIAAFEPEGMLFTRDTEGRLSPVEHEPCLSSQAVDRQHEFIKRLVQSLEEMGIVVEKFNREGAPGQYEFNLRFAPLLTASDQLAVFRAAFKTTARDCGLVGTFIPKPFTGGLGNGVHLHLSVQGDRGENLFFDAADQRGLGLSALGYQFIAGILAHAAAVTAVAAPSVNSYKRFEAHSWAPTHAFYGYANRAALVRVPERRRSRTIEFRAGDGTANPYLAAAAVVAAGLDGVRRCLDPGAPLQVSMPDLTVPELPHHLGEAIDAFKKDEVISSALGEEAAELFLRLRRSEWDWYLTHVFEGERASFSEIY